MNKFYLLLLSSLLVLSPCFGQNTFEVPKNAELKAKEDYAKYEADIIQATKWIEETDFDKESDKRKEVGRFLMLWLMGSPNVSIELNNQVLNLTEDNFNLLTVYFAGGTRYALENKESATKFNIVKACLTSVVKAYKKDIAVKKTKVLKKLVAAFDDNKLDDYIVNEMKVPQTSSLL